MAVTGRFVVVVALGALPVILLGRTPAGAWALAGLWLVLCAVLLLLDLLLAASPRRVEVLRDLPGRLRLGDTGTVGLTVVNRGGRRLSGAVRDLWQPSAGVPRHRLRVQIAGGERRQLSLPVTPVRRGERRTRGVTVRSLGPLGLAGRQVTLSAPATLRVLPPFASRRHLPSRLARLRELDGRAAVMVRGQGTEFDSLREYVRGDDVRSIDWRATARRDDLVVRTWRPERDRHVILVLDAGRASAARIADEPRLDTAMEAALLLGALATRAGDRVDAFTWDRRQRARVVGESPAGFLPALIDALAPVEPELIETDWPGLPARVGRIAPQRSLVVLLTAADTPGATRPLLAILPALTARHTVIVAAVADPLPSSVARDRGDRDAVYRAAAAERALLDAQRVAAAVRRCGADVVTAAPADLPVALADRYLALKAAGRL